ncbi:MAG: site-specific integrase [Pyrinomonadaceae bacterium]
MVTAERAADVLLRDAAPEARDATRALAEETAGPAAAFTALAHALLAVGESPSLLGLLKLSGSRAALLEDAYLRAGASETEMAAARTWLRGFERRLDAQSRTGRWQGLASAPGKTADRLHYFLWLAARGWGEGEDDAAAASALIPFCHRSLRAARRRRNKANKARGRAADKLPYRMAVFVQHFPRERLSGVRVAGGVLYKRDVRAAVETYYNSPKGFEEKDTLDEYVKQLTAALFPEPDAPRASAAPGGHVHRPGGVRVPEVAPDREVFTADDLDEDGRSVGLLTWQEPPPDDFSHPYESAQYVRFGAWQARHVARASSRWTTREVRVATTNELRRLLPLLDEFVGQDRLADSALLIWLALITGIQLKRLLSMQLLDEAAVTDSLNEAASAGEAPLYLCPERGMLFVMPANDPAAPSRLVDDAVYRRRARLVPVWIGERGRRYAAVALAKRVNPSSHLVFPRSPVRHLPEAQRYYRYWLRRIAVTALGQRNNFTWSKLSASLRPYGVEAGYTPLLSTVVGDNPTRPLRTILHYVAYDAARLLVDHARVVSHFERVAGFEPQGEPAFDVEGSLAPLVEGCFGAAYAPRPGLVARTWAAIAAIAPARGGEEEAERLNALTLRAAFALMASTGVRRQELAPLRRARLDLAARILRVEGKASAYFRESREMPLPELAVAELRAYVEATSGLDLVGSSDALFVYARSDGSVRELEPGTSDELATRLGVQVPFSTQALRNALRTEFHERGAPFEAVNEAFGHVTMEETVTHKLSGSYLPALQREFRDAAEGAALSLLGLRGGGA